MDAAPDRRPLKTRSAAWAQRLAAALASSRISPNSISVAGIAFACGGAAAILAGRQGWIHSALGYGLGAVGIQLRLLCNMLDGLVAVEGGKKSPTGDLFNEMPDRVEDGVLLVAAGYACGWAEAGWLCAVLAVLTAYIRAFGASLGKGQDFCGPGAKPQRMFLLTLGCLAAAGCALAQSAAPVLSVTLAAIAVLTGITACRRTVRLYRKQRR
jgi:phosphatidylglycerophosphate synthase